MPFTMKTERLTSRGQDSFQILLLMASVVLVECGETENSNNTESDGLSTDSLDGDAGVDADTNSALGDSDSKAIEDCVPRWPDDDCTRCVVFINGETGDDDNEDSSAGRSWETAFKTVQKGIDIAAESDCEIWVAAVDAGYTQDLDLVGSPALYGGFSGDETYRVQRDLVETKTILIGPGGGLSVISCKAADGCENGVVLDGFVITGGGSGGVSPGAGLYLEGGSVTLSNCMFQENYAEEQGGGGIYAKNSTLNIDKCIFSNNGAWAANGGAIWAESSTLTISLSTFEKNAAFRGGAIYSGTSSTLTVEDVTFRENMVWDGAAYGGAVYNAGDYQLFEGCEFIENSARIGGAVYNLQTSTTLIDSTFFDNLAKENWSETDNVTLIGGGIYNEGSKVAIIGCTFSHNSVELSDNIVYAEGGGIYNTAGSEADIINCLFTNHDTAVINRGSSPRIVGCTFSSNDQAIFNSNSALDPSFPIISNSIFWGNETQITDDANSTATSISTVTYCDIEGGFEGEGNIDADPLFETDSFMLREDSPCIDAGNTDALPEDVADLDSDENVEESILYDLNGSDRINGEAVDMGAFEF